MSTTSDLPPLKEGKIQRNDILGKDLAVDYGTIYVKPNEINYLDIKFKKVLTRFKINLNIRGLMGEFSPNTVARISIGRYYTNPQTMAKEFKEDIVQMGDFNLISQQPQFGTLTAQNNYNISLNTEGDIAGKSSKYTYIYTASFNPIPANQLTLRVKNLVVIHDDNAQERKFTPSSTDEIIIPINNTNSLPLERAITYNIIARLIESPLVVGQNKWARTNLIYNNSNPSNTNKVDRFIFRYDNNYTNPHATEYWESQTIDPCSKVYPNGLWRLPTRAQLQSLINAEGILRDQQLSLVSNILKFTQYDSPTISHIAYGNSNKLILPYFGYIDSQNNATNNHSSNSPEGQYWGYNTSLGYGYINLNPTDESYVTNFDTNEKRTIRCVRTQ